MSVPDIHFRKIVLCHYKKHGRHHLPWRKTKNPYRILVSEIMLQQTPVDRVLPKYQEFLKQFPSIKKLAAASLGDVLRAWQGLGYNRRAKYLHQCAAVIIYDNGGIWPRTVNELQALPGIGPYTAGAVMAFAYNQPIPIIETNIRTVYLHHFFSGCAKCYGYRHTPIDWSNDGSAEATRMVLGADGLWYVSQETPW